MKNKNKLAVIALLLAWLLVILVSLQFLNLAFVLESLVDKLCPMTITCSPDNPYDCVYPSCIWEFVLFIPLFIPLLLSIAVIILGFLSLKSEKRIVALLAIGIAIPILLFYLAVLWDSVFY